MIRLLLCFLMFYSGAPLFAQQLKGQWKGYFEDISGESSSYKTRYEYVLDLEANNNIVTGYSYTYFTYEGRRYYSICRVEGFLNPKARYLEVREVERTKTNIPALKYAQCLQVHKLTYDKKPNPETIKGQWIPATNIIDKECGYGNTFLSWRPPAKTDNAIAKANSVQQNNKTVPQRNSHSIAANHQPKKEKIAAPKKSAVIAKQQEETIHIEHFSFSSGYIEVDRPIELNEFTYNSASVLDFKKRNSHIQKTIYVNSDFITLSIYDNGEIDGDSISVFFNGVQLLKNKMLTDKPINIQLNIPSNSGTNELVLYAENLGKFPPNTALMVVTDDKRRHEVRVSCDLEKNAVIQFIRVPANKNTATAP